MLACTTASLPACSSKCRQAVAVATLYELLTTLVPCSIKQAVHSSRLLVVLLRCCQSAAVLQEHQRLEEQALLQADSAALQPPQQASPVTEWDPSRFYVASVPHRQDCGCLITIICGSVTHN